MPALPNQQTALSVGVNQTVATYIARGWTLAYVADPFCAILHRRGMGNGAQVFNIIMDVISLGGWLLIHVIWHFASTRKMKVYQDESGQIHAEGI